MLSLKQHIQFVLERDLSFSWYEAQKERFEIYSTYDPKKKTITVEYIGTIDESLEDMLEPQGRLFYDVNLEEYCWHDQQRNDIGQLLDPPEYPPYSPIDGIDVAAKISEILRQRMPTGDVSTSYKFIESAINIISEVIQSLKKEPALSYHKVLDTFYEKLKEHINIDFRDIQELYYISTTSVDKLEFGLNQDELTCLIYLLWEANFLHKTNKKDLSQFYTFCERHFYCRKQGQEGYSTLKNLQIKISDVRQGKTQAALDRIFNKLEQAAKRARKKG